MTNALDALPKTKARKARKPEPVPQVYVAPCNRPVTITPICLADRFREQLDGRLVRIIEAANTCIANFKERLETDAYNAFDWNGKSALEAAGKQRAAREVQHVLARMDAADDGYDGGSNLRTLEKLTEWITTEIMNKTRYGNPEEKDLKRMSGLAEIQDEIRFSWMGYQMDLINSKQRQCAAHDY